MHSIVPLASVPSGYCVWAASEHVHGLLVCLLLRQKRNMLLDLNPISLSVLFPEDPPGWDKTQFVPLCYLQLCAACPQQSLIQVGQAYEGERQATDFSQGNDRIQRDSFLDLG